MTCRVADKVSNFFFFKKQKTPFKEDGSFISSSVLIETSLITDEINSRPSTGFIHGIQPSAFLLIPLDHRPLARPPCPGGRSPLSLKEPLPHFESSRVLVLLKSPSLHCGELFRSLPALGTYRTNLISFPHDSSSNICGQFSNAP